MTTGRINQVCNASQLYRNDTAAHRKPGVIKHQPANCNNTSPENRHAIAKTINALSSCIPFKANIHLPEMALELNETQPALIHSHASPWSHGSLHTKEGPARPMGLGGQFACSSSPQILRTSTNFGRRPTADPHHHHQTDLRSNKSLGGGSCTPRAKGTYLGNLRFWTGKFGASPLLPPFRGCRGAAQTFVAPLPLPLPLPFLCPSIPLPYPCPIPALSLPYPYPCPTPALPFYRSSLG